MTTFVSKYSENFGGTASLPGDKSIAIRALILAAMAEGKSRITGLPASEDVRSTVAVLKALGVGIREEEGVLLIEGVGGTGFKTPGGPLDFGNSGTASRLMMGVFATQDISVDLTGDASLKKRPFGRVTTPLGRIGAKFSGDTLPFKITGALNPTAIIYDLPVASAQVKSALLLAGLNAPGETGVIERTPTRDHTEKLLGAFGVAVKKAETKKGKQITVLGPGVLKASHVTIPGDISAAAFLIVAALVSGTRTLVLKNVGVNPTRSALLGVVEKIGAKITLSNHKNDSGEEIADIHFKGGEISGFRTLPEEAPFLIDEFPILFIAAAFANGPSEFQGLGELRHKESDRLSLMAEGLKASGVKVRIKGDSLLIEPGPLKGGATIDACHDHRIAMAFLVMGLASQNPVTVKGAETISTSFPGFARVMNALGAKIEEKE